MIPNLSHVGLPKPKELRDISVKISKISDGNEILLGTGTIVSDGGEFYVLTAAHIFKDGSTGNYYTKEVIRLALIREDRSIALDIKELVIPEGNDDVAYMKTGTPATGFDYQHGPRILGEEEGYTACLYGYTLNSPDGRRYEMRQVGVNEWSSTENIAAKVSSSYKMFKGLSGGGLFTEVKNVIYCMGVVKEIDANKEKLDDIKMIPMSKYPIVWKNAYVESVESILGQEVKAKNCNPERAEYVRLWNTLYGALYDGKDVTELLKEIAKAKKSYPFIKYVRQQEQVISLKFRQQEIWPPSHQEAFMMAVADRGLWLSLFGEMPAKAGDIASLAITRQLEERGKTLTSTSWHQGGLLGEKDDAAVYENILRAAFSLDFKTMKELIGVWNPRGYYIAKKALLSNLFEQDDKALEKLTEYLDDETRGYRSEKYVATLIYNMVKGRVERGYGRFNNDGIESITEDFNFIASQIDKMKDKVEVYGIHYSQLFGGGDYTSFPEAIRMIQLIIDAGVSTSYRFNSLIPKENWLKVAKQLLVLMPFPVVYYTLMYSDENISKRVGQEIAFIDDDEFAGKRNELLVRLLHAIDDKNTPSSVFPGIYYLTSQLYQVVPEEVWFEGFQRSLLIFFCENIPLENVTQRDAIYQTVSEGVRCLRNSTYRAETLKALVSAIDKNPYLINTLIYDALTVDEDLWKEKGIDVLLIDLVLEKPLKKTYQILYKFCRSLKDSDFLTNLVEIKAAKDLLDFGSETPEAIGMLTYMVKDAEILKRMKEKVLSLDLWNCGITETSFSDPRPVGLELYNKDMEWTLEEWQVISENMTKNLELMTKLAPSQHASAHFNRMQIVVLSNMLIFTKHIRKKFGYDTEIETAINRLLVEKRGFMHPYEGLASSDYDKVVEAAWMLSEKVRETNVEEHLTEVGLLLNRVLLQQKEGLESCVALAAYLTKEYSESMVKAFAKVLIEILKKYCDDLDYRTLKINLPPVMKNIRLIAEGLKEQGIEVKPVEYWLDDEKANRFV